MLQLDKKLLGTHIVTRCERRLRLDLEARTSEAERAAADIPPASPIDTRTELLRAAGRSFEHRLLRAVHRAYGHRTVCRLDAGNRYAPLGLEQLLCAGDDRIGIEIEWRPPARELARFLPPALAQRRWHWARTRPDLVEVHAPRPDPDTEITAHATLKSVPPDSTRRGLRIIDIKRSAQARLRHLSEIAWYAWMLAARLAADGLDACYYVRADSAVWHDPVKPSALESATAHDWQSARAAIDAEATPAPMAVLLERIRSLLRDDLPRITAPEGAAWRHTLHWAIRRHCIECPYLGLHDVVAPTRDSPPAAPALEPRRCLAEAEATDSIVRIPDLPASTLNALRATGHHTVHACTTDHEPLVARGDLVRAARALANARIIPVEDAGAPELAPPPEIDLYIALQVDPSSTLIAAIAWIAIDHHAQRTHGPTIEHTRGESLAQEAAATRRWLEGIERIAHGTPDTARFQIHLWSPEDANAIATLLARHRALAQEEGPVAARLREVWPAPDALPAPGVSGEGGATHIVSQTLRQSAATPTPYVTALSSVARAIHAGGHLDPHPEYEDDLADRPTPVPIRRLWSDTGSNIDLDTVAHALYGRLYSLRTVVRWLRTHIGRIRATPAPVLLPRTVSDDDTIAPDLRALVRIAEEDQHLERHEAMQRWLRPVASREATHDSVRCTKVVLGPERTRILATHGIEDSADTLVLSTSETSRHCRVRPGQFGLVLIPDTVAPWAHAPPGPRYPGLRLRPDATLGEAFGIDLIEIDHGLGCAVARWNPHPARARMRAHAPACGLHAFDDLRNARTAATIESWIGVDRLRGLRDACALIGHPPASRDHPWTAPRAHGSAVPPTPRPRATEWLLWDPRPATVQRPDPDGAGAERAIAALAHGTEPTPAQRNAMRSMRTARFTLLWGPPGTGKTWTLASGIATCAWAAERRAKPLRILLSGPTWTAIDGLLDRSERSMRTLGVPVRHVRPSNDATHRTAQRSLASGDVTTIIATTHHQAVKLLTRPAREGRAPPRFDLLVIDEASQLDTAGLVRLAPCLDDHGSAIVAGDPLQMPPIAHAPRPEGAESLYGSTFAFFHEHHGVTPHTLDVSFRSHAQVIDAFRPAGYDATLRSAVPHRQLLIGPAPSRSATGKASWHQALEAILDPQHPVVALRHREPNPAQDSPLEARWCARIAQALHARLHGTSDQGRNTAPNGPPPPLHGPWADLFATRLGIVAPYHLQGVRIAGALALSKGIDPDTARSAVDTVERYQGQERDVIVLSMSAGDPEIIAGEESFLLDVQRINVALSRARCKIVILIHEHLCGHVPDAPHLDAGARLLAHATGHRLAHHLDAFDSDGTPIRVRWTHNEDR